MHKQISIIGLGWLGLPLAKHLLGEGYSIKGSTTREEKWMELRQKGLNAFKVSIHENTVEGEIEDCLQGSEIVIINIPPGLRRNPKSNYVAKIENVVSHIEKSSVKKVMFISSTSVFNAAENFPAITNATKPNSHSNAGFQIAEIERQLFNNSNFSTTILRFAGLIDERRHPVRMLVKKDKIQNPKAPINLIHLNDCIGICSEIILQEKWNEIYNAAFPLHPSKNEYYTKQALKRGLRAPSFDLSKNDEGKFINGDETAKALNYKYKYSVDF